VCLDYVANDASVEAHFCQLDVRKRPYRRVFFYSLLQDDVFLYSIADPDLVGSPDPEYS
jgi:hypothetical protein